MTIEAAFALAVFAFFAGAPLWVWVGAHLRVKREDADFDEAVLATQRRLRRRIAEKNLGAEINPNGSGS